MAAVLTSVSPLSGPPGTVITLTGTGIIAGAQVACPILVQTTAPSGSTLQGAIPSNLSGPSGGTMLVSVFIQNPDGSLSNMLPFTVEFPATALQAWTTIDQVCAEVPGFSRGGQISDDTITRWMVSISQSITGVLLQRGLPLNPTLWQQPDPNSITPSPAAVLEQIARFGAAARLASAISSQFASGPGGWSYATNLQTAFASEFRALQSGVYDKTFFPAAATVDANPTLAGGEVFTHSGNAEQAFRKGKVF
jgi:hypothetical protein